MLSFDVNIFVTFIVAYWGFAFFIDALYGILATFWSVADVENINN